ncbi:hypothetical protein ACFXKJ_30225 [Kitasatospora indigofera]|uniref:hypothetical protein n=1 Tax=Kitasatospora indigofera TaxID=67307 RepID=UPI0036CC43D9
MGAPTPELPGRRGRRGLLVGEEGRPRQTLARRRPDDGALVDGYVPQAVDVRLPTAVYTWVQAGGPGQVAEYLLDLLAEVCPVERTREASTWPSSPMDQSPVR